MRTRPSEEAALAEWASEMIKPAIAGLWTYVSPALTLGGIAAACRWPGARVMMVATALSAVARRTFYSLAEALGMAWNDLGPRIVGGCVCVGTKYLIITRLGGLGIKAWIQTVLADDIATGIPYWLAS